MVSTSRCSVISLTVRVLGTATSIPDCSTGAVIMKMISSTSTTSTSGVTLISASEERVVPVLLVKATVHRLSGGCGSGRARVRRHGGSHRDFLERVQQFAAKVVCGSGKDTDARGELVVGYKRGDGDKQPGSRGDERLGDSGRDRAQGGRSGTAQAAERVDDAHDSAEEPDVDSGGRDGGQSRHAAFEICDRLAGGRLRRALQWRQVARRSGAAGLALVGFVYVFKHLRQGAGFAIFGDVGDPLQAGGLADGAQETTRLPGGPAEGGDFAQDDRPGVKAGKQQQHQNRCGNRANVVDHFHEARGPGSSSRGGATISLEEDEEGSG